MPDTLTRQIRMLELIPQAPRKTTVAELHGKLSALGFDIERRSIERDLPKLSAHFGLISDGAKPAGWSWVRDARQHHLPSMDSGTALTFQLLERYLRPLLPKPLLKQLDSHFKLAKSTLDDAGSGKFGHWSRRIAALPLGHQLLPPDIADDVANVVYAALLQESRFEADYRARSRATAQRYEFNPLGLVYREGSLYLVATLWSYRDVRQFALHRMSAARLTDKPTSTPEKFNFDRYVHEEREFDYPVGSVIRLELRVNPWLATHLEESRLSTDQHTASIRGSDDKRFIARVRETEQLRWWLQSLGSAIEVLKPIRLRKLMASEAAKTAHRYRRSALAHGK